MRKKLNKKLCMDDIYEICILTHGNNRKKAHLYQLTFDEDERISTNALVGIHSFRHAEQRVALCQAR